MHASGGLELSSISTLHKKMQVGKAALLMTSRDSEVQHATKLQLQCENLVQRNKLKPVTILTISPPKPTALLQRPPERLLYTRMVRKEVQKQDVYRSDLLMQPLFVSRGSSLSCPAMSIAWFRAIHAVILLCSS